MQINQWKYFSLFRKIEGIELKIKLAKYVADFLADKGVEDVFTITGGGAMHLNDALGHNSQLHCTYNHHEQASAIAAEGYARLTGNVAAVCVTSGPGGTNAITGVLGGWQDSIPMFIISGQVKRETTTWSTEVPLRQLGDQEFQIVDCVKTMTKYAAMVTEPEKIKYHLEKAWFLCNHGRKGPVWLDIPLDVQAAIIEFDELVGYCAKEDYDKEIPCYDSHITNQIFEEMRNAKRPVILAGTGIRLADAYSEFYTAVKAMNIPVVTAWNAHDLLEYDSPVFCGKPGTVGTRGGNFVVQNADLLLVLGCRMNIRMISYNYKSFAENAKKIVVDIDENELKKPTVYVDIPVHADVKEVLASFCKELENGAKCGNHSKWLEWCRMVNQKYPAVLPEYFKTDTPLNPYAFMSILFDELNSTDNVICGNGSACVVTFQACKIKKGQRLFTNSGCAAMGYGFPAAIGVNIAGKGKKRTICIDGDGSFQMNLQELQTVVYNCHNLKIIILNNNGYHSIRQTQNNLFQPPLVGVCSDNGISFPNMEKIAYAYGISYVRISSLEQCRIQLQNVLQNDENIIVEVVIDEKQNFAPKLSSKIMPDGSIVSPSIDDMYPFLPKKEYEERKEEALLFE